MEFSERLGWMLLGGAVGFVLGYIVARLREIGQDVDVIKEEVEEIDSMVKHQRDEQGLARIHPLIADIVLLLVVAMVAYAAFAAQSASNKIEQTVKDNKIKLCQAGEGSRTVQRATVDAIYELATAATERPANAPPLTKQQVKQYNAYIDRVNKFRNGMYKKIKPSKSCAPYVDDNNVKPPTQSMPHIRK